MVGTGMLFMTLTGIIARKSTVSKLWLVPECGPSFVACVAYLVME